MSSLYGKFRKIPVFREIPPPHHSPQPFIGPLEGNRNPPPNPPTPIYVSDPPSGPKKVDAGVIFRKQ